VCINIRYTGVNNGCGENVTDLRKEGRKFRKTGKRGK